MTPYWARKRSDDYFLILHEDWIVGDFQLAYRVIDAERSTTGESFFRLFFRKRKGRFGVSGWLVSLDFRTHEELCSSLRKFLKKSNDDINIWFEALIEEEHEKERKAELQKYCGFDPKKRMIW